MGNTRLVSQYGVIYRWLGPVLFQLDFADVGWIAPNLARQFIFSLAQIHNMPQQAVPPSIRHR